MKCARVVFYDENGNVYKEATGDAAQRIADTLRAYTIPPTATYEGHGGRRYVRTSEHRRPRAGEFYLSGAIPYAYRAPSDLPSSYWICKESAND